MLETIGKKLSQARLAKGLSIEEAAHVTRVRPEKLTALENDDYSRFGSNAYAKSFLQIYGRFLGVDVSQQAAMIETSRHLSVSEYQYLNNAPQPERSRVQLQRYDRRPSVVPLLLAMGLIVVGAVAMIGFWINVNMQRLELKESRPAVASQTALPAAAAGTAPLPAIQSGPVPRATEPGLAPVSNPLPASTGENIHSGGVGAANSEGAAFSQAFNGSVPAVAPVAATNEIVVEPLKKTWVKIRRDNSTATPIFEDYLYPGVRPLTLRGERFYVEVREQDAVQIRKNGSPIAYQAPGISIQ